MNRQFFHIIPIFLALIFLASCSPKQYLKENNQVLHVKNTVEITQEEGEYVTPVSEYALKSLARPKENGKFLGTHMPQGIYFKGIDGYEGKEKDKIPGWNRFLMNFGGEPELYDSIQVSESEEKINGYLENKGFFNSRVSSETTYSKDSLKTRTKYNVYPGKQHVYGTVQYDYDSLENISDIVSNINLQEFVKTGDAHDAEDLIRLRNKIESEALEKGYYHFTKSAVYIDRDTLRQDGVADLYVVIEDEDSLFNQPFYIDDIRLVVNNSRRKGRYSDTTILYNEKAYAYMEKIMVRPKVLDRFILFEKGNLYSKTEHYNTIRKLYDLPIVQVPIIKFIEDKNNTTSDSLFLDAVIDISTKDKLNLRFSPTISEFQGPALGADLALTHRNLFKGGELFQFPIAGGLESGGTGSNETKLFGTWFYDVEPSITFPRLLGLERIFPDTYKNTTNQNTKLTFSYARQDRPGLFDLEELSARQTWNWKSSEHNNHELSLIDVSLVTAENIDPDYEATVNPTVLFSLQDRLILSSSYTYSYSNIKKRSNKSHFSFSGTFETAGNLPYLFSAQDTLRIGGNDVSRYVRGIVDFKYNFKIGNESSLVTRLNFASALPIGSIESIPAVKQFFAGGNNSMRGWRPRSLGPGGSNFDFGDELVDLRGDMRIETNLEYRFPLTKLFGQTVEGTLFTDIGNIWTFNDDVNEEANFSSNFLNDVAIAAGPGLRFKIQNFLILRGDLGFRLRDPALPDGNRWTEDPLESPAFQFGIGYPF